MSTAYKRVGAVKRNSLNWRDRKPFQEAENMDALEEMLRKIQTREVKDPIRYTFHSCMSAVRVLRIIVILLALIAIASVGLYGFASVRWIQAEQIVMRSSANVMELSTQVAQLAITPTHTPEPEASETVSFVVQPTLYPRDSNPTTMPTPVVGYGMETYAIANRDFGTNVYVKFTMGIDGTRTYEQVQEEMQSAQTSLVKHCNLKNNSNGHIWNDPDSRGVEIFGNRDNPVTEDCFSYVSSLGGNVIDRGLPEKVLAELRKNPATEENTKPDQYNRLIFLSNEDGHVIGTLRGVDKVPQRTSCLDFSMEQVGWNGEDYLVYNVFNATHEIHEHLWHDAAVISLDEGGPEIPDFCETQNLSEVPQPSWLTVKNSNDALSIKLEELDTRIHVDPTKCDQYPNMWANGEYLLEVFFEGKYQRVATFDNTALLLFDKSFGLPSNMVYLRLEDGKPHWYTPAGIGLDRYRFEDVPAIWLNPMVDGISPWVSLRESPLTYLLNDGVYKQTPAVYINESGK